MKRAPRRDRAFLLRRHLYGESSLVAHVLAREYGRVALIAKGAYRPTSRYFCVLDHFDTLELEWSAPPGADLAVLSAGRVVELRSRIPEAPPCYRAAHAVLELAELAARAEHPEGELFDLTRSALDALDSAAGAQSEAAAASDRALVRFELGFLASLGLAPALEDCASCARPAPALEPDRRRAAFSAGAGGRLCRPCAEEAGRAGRRVGTLPVDVLSAASRVARGEVEAPLPANLAVHVRDFLERFLDYHLETRPRALRSFLSAPNRNAPPRARA